MSGVNPFHQPEEAFQRPDDPLRDDYLGSGADLLIGGNRCNRILARIPEDAVASEKLTKKIDAYGRLTLRDNVLEGSATVVVAESFIATTNLFRSSGDGDIVGIGICYSGRSAANDTIGEQKKRFHVQTRWDSKLHHDDDNRVKFEYKD